MSRTRRMALIGSNHDRLSIVRQCQLAHISRSALYYAPAGESVDNHRLMRVIDAQYLDTPWCGSRQMTRHLRRAGEAVNRKRIRRLMQLMGRYRPTVQDIDTGGHASDLFVFIAQSSNDTHQ